MLEIDTICDGRLVPSVPQTNAPQGFVARERPGNEDGECYSMSLCFSLSLHLSAGHP